MNRQQLLSRLGRSHGVLYTNGPLSTWDIGKARWRSAAWLGDFVCTDNVIVDRPPAALLRMKGRPWCDAVALGIAAARWRHRLTREGAGPLVAYAFHPKVASCALATRAEIVVYHAYDLFHLQTGWNAAMAAEERSLITRADIVIGSSVTICDQLRAQGAQKPVLVPNAADFAAFSTGQDADAPRDLSDLPRPRVGYIGKISRKVDMELLGALARTHPTWQFVFVGSVDSPDADSRSGIADLRTLPNVHFLGFKAHTELPAYAARMDVNVIAHRLDDDLWTRGTFPLKLYEYLAAGPPVVSSDIPSVRQHSDVVTIARTKEDWDRALSAIVEHGLAGSTVSQRQAVAAANTWDDRVQTIQGLLFQAFQDRPASSR